jgi:hypothetical protein
LAPSNPTRAECICNRTNRLKDGETKVGTKNLDWAKAGLEMTLIYSIFLAFLHAFSNVIQSCQILQIIEQLSFKFHQG